MFAQEIKPASVNIKVHNSFQVILISSILSGTGNHNQRRNKITCLWRRTKTNNLAFYHQCSFDRCKWWIRGCFDSQSSRRGSSIFMTRFQLITRPMGPVVRCFMNRNFASLVANVITKGLRHSRYTWSHFPNILFSLFNLTTKGKYYLPRTLLLSKVTFIFECSSLGSSCSAFIT